MYRNFLDDESVQQRSSNPNDTRILTADICGGKAFRDDSADYQEDFGKDSSVTDSQP